MMHEIHVGSTPITDAQLIVPAATAPQHRLAEATASAHRARVAGMPSLDRTGPLDLMEMSPALSALAADPEVFPRLLSAVAWADAPGFSWVAPRPNSTGPGPAHQDQIASAAELRRRLTNGAVLSIGRGERWVRCLSELHDLLTLATRSAVSTSVLTAAVPCERSSSPSTVLVGLSGSAAVSVAGEAHRIEPGRCLAVHDEDVEIEPDGTASWAEMSLRSVATVEMLAELRRRAGYSPLFRADVPPDPSGPIASWGGSLLDTTERFAESLAAHLDETLPEGTRARWWSGLRLSPLPISTTPPGDTELLLPAPPAFLDPRLCAPDLVVLATAGALVPLDPARLDQLLALAEGEHPDPADGHALIDTLSDLDVLRPC